MEIIEFDNLDDMLAYQAKMAVDAEAAMLPTQRAMKPGTYWMRPIDDIGMFIFGYWPTLDEIYESERSAGADEQEAQFSRSHEEEKSTRGFMYGKAFSPMEPDGEFGTTHASVCWPITEDQFKNAQTNLWEIGASGSPDPENPLIARWFVDLLEGIKTEIANEILVFVLGEEGSPFFNLRNISIILQNPQWHEPSDADEG